MATFLRGVGDIRTALTAHLHSRPAQKGTAQRDLYLLGKEGERLEQELARLARQRERVRDHLAQTLEEIARLQQAARAEDPVPRASAGPGDGNSRPVPPESTRPQWGTMPLDY